MLAFDGVLSAIAAALFLPLYIGAIPLPISALISGLVNAALVWAGLQLTTAPRLSALPLWTWLVTVALLTLGGPGEDIVFGGTGFSQYGVLVLLVLGVVPPAVVLRRNIRLPG